MIISPLEPKNSIAELAEGKSIYSVNEEIVNEIIEYLLSRYMNELLQIKDDIEKENFIRNVVKERMISKYSNKKEKIESISEKVLNKVLGYYIIQRYIDNGNISDIRVISFDDIFIKEKGKWRQVEEQFEDEKDLLNFTRSCILKNGGKINNENPIAIVSDKKKNLRIEAGIAPVNVVSPNLVIRIHRNNAVNCLEKALFLDSYMFNLEMYIFLIKMVVIGVNIVICGKGGSGKTTLLRALVNKIPNNIAITSNEETAELFSSHKNIIQREIIQNRKEDKNVSLAKLAKQCLVMSNDVIVVGELKGEETMNFVDAICTGHVGYATVHANSSLTTISRLIMLMKRDDKATTYSNEYLEEILGQSIDVIIYMEKFKIQEITEVEYDEKKKKCKYNLIYKYVSVKNEKDTDMGYFKKYNECLGRIKEKLKHYEQEIERIVMDDIF